MNPRDKAISPFEEEQHQVQLAKSARLRELRSHASWLAFDPHAQFHDEIDLSAIFEENASRPPYRATYVPGTSVVIESFLICL